MTNPSIPTHLAELDPYLADQEAAFPNIRPNTEKRIVWARPASKQQTPLSLIYLHGFSATRQEIAPLPEIVAQNLGANLFYTRLTGHGQDGSAMGNATMEAWLSDAEEAYTIGRRLGQRLLIMGTSTGGTLATWLALQPLTHVAGIVLFSPNFGLYDRRGDWVLGQRTGKLALNLLVGKIQHWQPRNEGHARYWTNDYPSKAFLPMMQLVNKVRTADVGSIPHPVCMMYCPRDRVISPTAIVEMYRRWGNARKLLLPVSDSTNDEVNHLIAGDIFAPHDTLRLARSIIAFCRHYL